MFTDNTKNRFSRISVCRFFHFFNSLVISLYLVLAVRECVDQVHLFSVAKTIKAIVVMRTVFIIHLPHIYSIHNSGHDSFNLTGRNFRTEAIAYLRFGHAILQQLTVYSVCTLNRLIVCIEFNPDHNILVILVFADQGPVDVVRAFFVSPDVLAQFIIGCNAQLLLCCLYGERFFLALVLRDMDVITLKSKQNQNQCKQRNPYPLLFSSKAELPFPMMLSCN